MIAPTSPKDARFVADNLSDDEICVRLYGREEASRLAFEVATTSPLSWVVYTPEAEPAAMFGAFGDEDEPFGHAWLFSTDKVTRAARSLVQGAAFGVAISRNFWPELRIDAEPRSKRQARFLEYIGFKPRAVEERDGETWTELWQ